MKRFIITGAPGAGKTAVIRQLQLEGFDVVEEAATDAIAAAQARGTMEPWKDAAFVDVVARLQKHRQMQASNEASDIQFHDRSVVCTAALAVYLGHPVSEFLASELKHVKEQRIFECRVFFLRNLGFITLTDARRISFAESLRFERIHEDTYREFGFDLFPIERGSVPERAKSIKEAVGIA